MKILLLYPQFPETYWSFKHALKFIGKKSANIPLGILTVSALLPEDWEKRFTDLNVNPLMDEDIRWADYIFISAISVQSASVAQIIDRCKALDAKIVGGGPLFAEMIEQFDCIEHLILNEAEITLPQFIEDLAEGHPRKIYQTDLLENL